MKRADRTVLGYSQGVINVQHINALKERLTYKGTACDSVLGYRRLDKLL